MAKISSQRVQEYIQISNNAETKTQKGRALEDLICYIFEKIPGISVTVRDELNTFATEEIDIAFWNEKDRTNLYSLPDTILVECKNWSSPVSSIEVSWFITKLRTRGLNFGILIAVNGITGTAENRTAAHSIIASALQEVTPRRMIIITLDEIREIENSTQLLELIKRKICELHVYGTALP